MPSIPFAASEVASSSMVNLNEATEGWSQEARGRSPDEPLVDHNVVCGQSVNVSVSMAVHRETMDLQPCELKLVVEQVCMRRCNMV